MAPTAELARATDGLMPEKQLSSRRSPDEPVRPDDVEIASEQAEQFAELLRAHHRSLFVFIYSLVQNRADAEDVYQQTALVLWRKYAEFTPGTNFSAWATRVAHLTARHFIRSRRRQHPCFSDEILELLAGTYQPTTPEAQDARMEALAHCLAKLPRRDRKLVDQCYAADRNIAQIAADENRTVASIHQAVYRVRKALLACVERRVAAENR